MNEKAFDFECVICGLREEFWVRDQDVVRCPNCHAILNKLPPAVGLINPTKPGMVSGDLKEGGRKCR